MLLLVLVVLGAPTGARAASGFALELDPVASGLSNPLGLTHAGDGSGRLFVVEQTGTIRIVEPDGQGGWSVPATPFLDLSGSISCCSERGLLGLVFHPDYATNGYFYVHYTDAAEDSILARFEVSATDPDRADPASEVLILSVEQPRRNHNGGQLAFGPDGYLYVALGDGGGAGDPEANGQDRGTLLGTLLRLDVDAPGVPYAVPADNPFVGVAGARDEIWAWGLRNPWRFSFDRLTGDLWIADVGQNLWEEINREPAGAVGGRNYGWPVLEGSSCFEAQTCNRTGLVEPTLEYSHDLGCSVTGGYLLRQGGNPGEGVYVFADFCTGRLYGATPRCEAGWRFEEIAVSGLLVTSFGEGEDGTLYVLGWPPGSSDGQVHRLAFTPTSEIFADDFEVGDRSAWTACR